MVNSSYKNIILIIIATLVIGCGNSITSQSTDLSSSKQPKFRPPIIPATIAGVENRREYLATHYWDSVNFADTTLLKNDSIMGVAIGGYIQVLMMNSPATVEKSIEVSLSRVLKSGYDQYEQLTSKFEDYLYNPNSPMRNEELYIHILRYTVEKADLEDIYKIRSRNQLKMALKNRIGEVATDFQFESIDGKTSTLYAIKSPYTILFFNSPDCDDCRRVKEYIGESKLFSALANKKELTILGVYPEQDIEMWHKAQYPSIILNSADIKCEIANKQLYDLKALPTMYLLDRDKIVILKDQTVENIEAYLRVKR